ncbi:hypothetical protein D3C73_611260 [compost metagenome]
MLTNSFFQNRLVKRLFIFALIALSLYLLRSMINLILITFIITFLMNRVTVVLNQLVPINRKIIIAVLYTTLIIILVVGVYKYLPVIITQISQLIKQVSEFYTKPQDNQVVNYFIAAFKGIELTKYMQTGFDFLYVYVSNIGKGGIQFLLALILSLFFLLEKNRIVDFTMKFKTSKISAFYNELEYFGTRFQRSFGKVIEVQFLIATINCVLSTIALWMLGFPQLFGLALMIFLLGLIPVAGVVISLIPLCTIAFSIGGVPKVIWILVLIAVIHALESYILNPKLMSSKTDLPVFYTFIILIFSEHFFGVWGLIIGIPVFIFLLDVLDVVREKPKLPKQDPLL